MVRARSRRSSRATPPLSVAASPNTTAIRARKRSKTASSRVRATGTPAGVASLSRCSSACLKAAGDSYFWLTPQGPGYVALAGSLAAHACQQGPERARLERLAAEDQARSCHASSPAACGRAMSPERHRTTRVRPWGHPRNARLRRWAREADASSTRPELTDESSKAEHRRARAAQAPSDAKTRPDARTTAR